MEMVQLTLARVPPVQEGEQQQAGSFPLFMLSFRKKDDDDFVFFARMQKDMTTGLGY
jgi:hypothetical protein